MAFLTSRPLTCTKADNTLKGSIIGLLLIHENVNPNRINTLQSKYSPNPNKNPKKILRKVTVGQLCKQLIKTCIYIYW